jgi:quercetin dioxygenase-like cupin family protein
MKAINLLDALAEVTEFWSPKVVGRVNDQFVKVAKLKGEFVWHKHDLEDELFQVIKGELAIQFEDRDPVRLTAGEFFVVPKGVMHSPVAEEECWIMLVETATTKHTGDVTTPLTKSIAQQLGL